MRRFTGLRGFFAAVLAVAGTFAPGAAPAAARDWQPGRVTMLLGHTLTGRDGLLARALAVAWGDALGATVTIEAHGRASALVAATEFAGRARDGTVVLAGDLGELALAYARRRPSWAWDRTLAHLAVYACDPAFLVAPAPADPGTLERTLRTMRSGTASVPVAVGSWLSLDSLLLADAAVVGRLGVRPVPVGSGAALTAALADSALPFAIARRTQIADGEGDLAVLAAAATLQGETGVAAPRLDAAFGTAAVPAGAIAVVSVPAGLQRDFPDRYERLARSLKAARADDRFHAALERFGLAPVDEPGPAPEVLLASVRIWWDAWHRAGRRLETPPEPVRARARITRLWDGARRVAYLGLDGKTHMLRLDPDGTALVIGGRTVTGGDPLAALKIGMLCEIARPSPAAREAVQVRCP